MKYPDNIVPEKHAVILFDGVCNLCSGAVQFFIKRDKDAILKYASLQSESGQALLQEYGLPLTQFNSFVFIHNKKVYLRSSAALQAVRMLSAPLNWLYGFIIVPRFIRDGVYNIIAKNRYKWFGQQESCMIPTPELKSRFLP